MRGNINIVLRISFLQKDYSHGAPYVRGWTKYSPLTVVAVARQTQHNKNITVPGTKTNVIRSYIYKTPVFKLSIDWPGFCEIIYC